jgi:hypothetical protein
LHHFGFVVENENAIEQEIKKHGGEFFMQLPNLDVGVARTDHHPVVAVEQQIAEVMAAIEVGESRPKWGYIIRKSCPCVLPV